jgi:hypothetical protein
LYIHTYMVTNTIHKTWKKLVDRKVLNPKHTEHNYPFSFHQNNALTPHALCTALIKLET